jgi:hypothetical protein
MSKLIPMKLGDGTILVETDDCELIKIDPDKIHKEERKRVLNKLLRRVNDISEYAFVPCHDGHHNGMYETDVIRISYLEEEMEKLCQNYQDDD